MKAIIILIFVFFYSNLNGQVRDYPKFINDKFLYKKQIVKTSDGKEEIVYLGEIKDIDGNILFYILAIYSEVQAAILTHGHSNVLYLDKEKIIEKQFELDLSGELPFKLKNNTLYFHYYNKKTNKLEFYKNYVGIEIPKLLCVGPEECY